MISSYQVPYYVGNTFPNAISDDTSKIFVGGVPADATKETIMEYFSTYGTVTDCIIMVDNVTGRSRGFGFVTFVDANAVNKVLASNKHVINGKCVDAKRAVPKGPNQTNILKAMGITSNRADRNPDCKIFVGGVAQGTTESDLEVYFKEFGQVLEVKIPKDQNTQRARGFSFVLFESPECVISATKERYHRINGKTVEVKTVEQQPSKLRQSEGSEDGHLQSPASPYMLGQGGRSAYYPGYAQSGYLGPGVSAHGFYDHPGYEPSASGSTGSAASLESSGYGGISSPNPRAQGLESYSYMAPLYPGMADLSISQRYPGVKSYRPVGNHYHQLASGNQVGGHYQSSGPSQSFNDYPTGGGAYNPNFALSPGGNVPPVAASYAPASTQQPGSNQTFTR